MVVFLLHCIPEVTFLQVIAGTTKRNSLINKFLFQQDCFLVSGESQDYILVGGWQLVNVESSICSFSVTVFCNSWLCLCGTMGINSRQHLRSTISGKKRVATQLSFSEFTVGTVKCIDYNVLLNGLQNTGSAFHSMGNKNGILQFAVRMRHVLFGFQGSY